MKSLAIALTMLLAALVPPTAAQQTYQPIETGNDLLRACAYFWSPEALKSESDTDFTNYTMDLAECGGFFIGFLQTTAVWRGIDPTRRAVDFCLPFGEDGRSAILLGQVVRITKKWMDENPDQTHKSAAWIIRKALLKAFPCRKKTG